MKPALTILLFTVATSESEDPFASAVVDAIRQALGPDTQVTSRPVSALPGDADAVEQGGEIHADAVAQVAWSTPEHLRVTIRLEPSTSARWMEREITFRETDEPRERSRTVGFTVASMLPESFLRRPTAMERSETTTAPGPDRAPSSVELPPRRPIRHWAAISGAGVVAFGVGDNGTSFGGAVDFRPAVSNTLALRIVVGVRGGRDPAAEAVTRFFSGGAGVAWSAWTSANGVAAVGFRLDALVVRAELSRASGSVIADEAKWMPGADAVAEAAYFFTPVAAIGAGAGAEAVFGRTDVFVDGRRVTTYRPVHPIVELGLRFGF